MITTDEVRRLALALAGTEEHTHYRLPAFGIEGATFAVMKPAKQQVLLYLDAAAVQDTVAEAPDIFDAERPGRPSGVWVDLTQVAPDQFERLLKRAWRAKAG